jgi:hypothetical protein
MGSCLVSKYTLKNYNQIRINYSNQYTNQPKKLMNSTIRIKLSVMMFLEFFIWEHGLLL